MSVIVILFAFISVSLAQPNEDYQVPEVQNVITVPPNCPEGQELINGQCRDIWTWKSNPNAADLGVIDPSLWFRNRNVITVPTNCPPGQQLINGVCRDVWRFSAPTTPLPKQDDETDLDQRGRRQTDTEVEPDTIINMLEVSDQIDRNIISIPNQCPAGYKLDAFGYCRRILVRTADYIQN